MSEKSDVPFTKNNSPATGVKRRWMATLQKAARLKTIRELRGFNKKGEKHVRQKDLYRIIHRRNDDNYGIWTKRCRAVLDKPGGRLGWHRNFRTGRAAAVQGTDEFHGRRQLYRIRRRRQLLRRQPGARRLGTDWRYKFTNLRGDVSPAFLRP